MGYKKPPLGIEPEVVWVERRVAELGEAINRYINAGIEVPAYWVEEYNRHKKNLKEIKKLFTERLNSTII